MQKILYALFLSVVSLFAVQLIILKDIVAILQLFLLAIFCILLVIGSLNHFLKTIPSKSFWLLAGMFALIPAAIVLPVAMLFKILHWEHGDQLLLISGLFGILGIIGAGILMFRSTHFFSMFLIMSFLLIQIISLHSLSTVVRSTEISSLNAFHIVNNGIENSTTRVENFHEQVYKDIAALPPSELSENQKKILRARKIAESLFQDLDVTKRELIQEMGFRVDAMGNTILVVEANTKIPTFFFVNQKAGYKVQDNIMASRAELLSLIEIDEDRTAMAESLPLIASDEDIPSYDQGDWVMYNFADVPSIAALTILSKLQNDVRVAEMIIVKYLIQTDQQ